MQHRLMAGVVGLSLVVAACGDDASTESTGSTDTVAESVDVTTTGAPVDATVRPTTIPATTPDTAPATTEPMVVDGLRLLSLSPALTEMVFAIGADEMLVAVDSFSNYPPEALDLPHELSAYEPNVEAIAGYEPDVVLISGDFTGLGDQLEPLGIEIWDGPAATTLADTYAQLEGLGDLTGHEDEAATVIADMQAEIDEIVASLPPTSDEPLTYFHELGPELYTATSDTFIGAIYGLLGLENVADAAADDTSYPQLNAEFLIEANPDLIFLADTKCCAESLETVAARPGWDAIAAVQTGAVIEMDDDIASRWGPRIVDYLRTAADAVEAQLAAA